MRKPYILINKIIYPSKFKYAKRYKKIDDYSLEEINNIKLKKLNKLLSHFKKMCFYSNILKDEHIKLNSTEKIKCLPIIEKKFIRYNINKIKKIDNNAVMRSTSGSTGENLRFYITKMRRAAAAGALYDFLDRIGVIQAYGKTIGIWGGNLHKPGEHRPFIDWLKRFILDIELLPGYGLNEAMSIKYIKKINNVKPALLYGYPTYLDTLAKYGKKNRIKSYTPTAIVVSGEQLSNSARNRIEKYFKTRIYNRYGSVEFGVIAHELNEKDILYINPLRYIVESDRNDELLITDLDNYVTPFIRYKIGDMGELKQKGNWQVISNLKGRTNDVIETKTGKIIPSQFFTILSRTVKGTEKYQFIQISETKIEMKLMVNENFEKNGIKIIKENFKKNFGDEVELIVTLTNKIEKTKAGKHKFVIKKG